MSIQKIVLLSTLFCSCAIHCIDADIFKETLTLSTPVEAQEQPAQKEVSVECAWIATKQCRAQFKAYNNASPNDNHAHIAATLEACLLSAPCVQKFKKHTRLD